MRRVHLAHLWRCVRRGTALGDVPPASLPAGACAACPVRASDAATCPRRASAPKGPIVQRAAFMRGLGAAAGLVTLSATGALQQLLAPLTAAAATSRARSVAPGPGVLLGSVRTLARNQARAYTDPASGDPALLLHLADGRYVAYDAVCTHAGCTVQYDPTRRQLVCPCHGAAYDPARGAAVIAGPAPSPLTPLAIRVDAQGHVYALDGRPGSGQPAPKLQKAQPYRRQTGDDDSTGRRHRRRRGDNGGDDGNGGGRQPPGDDYRRHAIPRRGRAVAQR